MHQFLPLERLTSHAPGHHNAEGAWKGSGSQPDSAPLARGFSAEPGGDPARVGYCAESPPRCCRPSFPGFGSRNSAFISKRTTLRLRSTASRVIQLTVLSLFAPIRSFFRLFFSPPAAINPRAPFMLTRPFMNGEFGVALGFTCGAFFDVIPLARTVMILRREDPRRALNPPANKPGILAL